MKKWLNKPITWGSYFAFGGICTVLGLILTAVFWIASATITIDNFKAWIDESIRRR